MKTKKIKNSLFYLKIFILFSNIPQYGLGAKVYPHCCESGQSECMGESILTAMDPGRLGAASGYTYPQYTVWAVTLEDDAEISEKYRDDVSLGTYKSQPYLSEYYS